MILACVCGGVLEVGIAAFLFGLCVKIVKWARG